jgi:hypothetical protein
MKRLLESSIIFQNHIVGRACGNVGIRFVDVHISTRVTGHRATLASRRDPFSLLFALFMATAVAGAG